MKHPRRVSYARAGAVVLLIDAPFARRATGLEKPLTFTEQDRREQIQFIIDLRREVDLLLLQLIRNLTAAKIVDMQ